MAEEKYTAKLQAGLALINDTLLLIDLWEPGQTATALKEKALDSGLFSSMTARRLRNIVLECFKPRYLVDSEKPAKLLKAMAPLLSRQALIQLMFIFTCRAISLLRDFVTQVYWGAYASGRSTVANYMAQDFVREAVEKGRTTTVWSDSVINSMASRLTGACAEFGLLEEGARSERNIKAFGIDPNVALILAYDLHFSGLGDNAVVASPDWGLFGLEKFDVVETLRRAAVKGGLIVQNAGEAVSISWKYKSMEELEVACDWR